MYRKHRTHINNYGEKLTDNQVKAYKRDYAEEHQLCECCHKSTYGLAIHHHVKQGYRHLGEEYALEFADNYSFLCMDCHQQLHASSNQYERNNHKLPKSYFETLKDGQEPEYYIQEYLKITSD